MVKITRCVIAAVMLVALTSATAMAQNTVDPLQTMALCEFEGRIGRYAALHRELEARLPLKPTASMYILSVKRAYLAGAIKRARPAARQGDIFTPDVAELFRDLIARALSGRNAEAMLNDLYEDHPTYLGFQPRVYDPYPDWATHEMPMILLQWLPPLPEDVEYRLIDHDLLLWDIHADLILDVLPDAVQRPSS